MRVQAMSCDRCGVLFIEDNMEWNFTHKAVDNKSEARKIDFCPDCMTQFKEWLNGKEVVEE